MKEYLSRGTYIFPRDRASGSPSTPSPTRCARAQVEPDQRVQLPPAGGRGHAGAGDRLHAGHGHRCARRRPRVGQGRRLGDPRRRRAHLVLRQLERPLRRGDVQDAGLHAVVGPHLPRALRGGRPQAASLPLRRPGQLARPDRAAAREQRAADCARATRCDAVEGRTGSGVAAAGVERGAGPAPPLGPAVVAAHAAGAGLRDRPARVRRHLRGLARRRGQDGLAGRGGLGRARRRAGDGRCLRRHRRAEAAPGPQPGGAGAAHRAGGAEGRRRELLHRDGALAAGGRRRRGQHPQGRSQGRGGADPGRGALARVAGRRGGATGARRAAPGGRGRRSGWQRDGGDHRPGPRGRDDG